MATGRVPTTANSPLTAKGDLFGYSTTQARVAVGNNGETLVADSSTSTGLRYTAGNPIPNPVINSAFQVWQRGTSVAVSASSQVYTADRWNLANGANAMVVARQSTNDTTNLPNIQYCARVQRNSGQTSLNLNAFNNSFETINSIPYAGKTVTFSFYARAGANYSAASNALGATLYSGTGTDQQANAGYTGTATVATVTATLTTTWQRFTVSGTVASTATELTTYFTWTPTGTAGANDYYEITGVQIDIGSVALPFRTYAGTIQGELAACQRYYWRTPSTSVYSTYNAFGLFATTTAWQSIFMHPVQMRTAATSLDFSASLNAFDGVNQFALSSLAITTNQSTPNGTYVSGTVSGATAFRPAFIINNNSASSFVGFSAEL
jgi:hypothetical protein